MFEVQEQFEHAMCDITTEYGGAYAEEGLLIREEDGCAPYTLYMRHSYCYDGDCEEGEYAVIVSGDDESPRIYLDIIIMLSDDKTEIEGDYEIEVV